jgi:ABC-type branched-subunit amino acid transport system ATPase component
VQNGFFFTNASIGPWRIDSNRNWYFFSAILAVAVLIVVTSIVRGKWGRGWLAIRANDIAAGISGTPVTRYRVLVFALGSSFMSLQGIAQAYFVGVTSYLDVTLGASVAYAAMIIVGGVGTITGPAIGALVIIGVPYSLSLILGAGSGALPYWESFAYGAIVIVFLLAEPGGLAILGKRLFRKRGDPAFVFATTAVNVEVKEVPKSHDPAITSARAENWLTSSTRAPVEAGRPFIDSTEPPTMDALAIADVTVRFGALQVLSDVSLAVPRNSTMGLLGRNGAGKTTLLNCVSGLVRPVAGEVSVFGKSTSALRVHQITRLGVSRTFQNPNVFFDMRVIDAVMLGRAKFLRGSLGSYAIGIPWWRGYEQLERDQAIHALEFVGYRGRVDGLMNELPFGVAKLVDLARAIASNPGLLLLDEPSSGLSTDEIGHLEDTLTRLRSNWGSAAQLLIEHNYDFVRRLCDTVTVIDAGIQVMTGPTEMTLSDDSVQEALLGVLT